MSLPEMQSCLVRLYTDFAFQQLFFLDPITSLQEYQLSQAEMQALTGLNRTQLKRFAVSLRNKSQDKFERAFPLLFKAAGPQINRYFPRFYHLFGSQPEEAQYLNFGSFMEQTLKGDPELPLYLSELARFECQLITAELKADDQLPIPAKSYHTNSLENQPVLFPGVTCATYNYNVVALAQAIRQEQKLDQFAASSYIFLVYPVPGKVRPQILELNPATSKLIDYCNSELTIAEIIGQLEQTLGQANLQEVVIQNLDKLARLGVLNA